MTFWRNLNRTAGLRYSPDYIAYTQRRTVGRTQDTLIAVYPTFVVWGSDGVQFLRRFTMPIYRAWLELSEQTGPKHEWDDTICGRIVQPEHNTKPNEMKS